MTPQERDLVQGLLDRLASAPPQQKDPEAEALIRAAVQRNPDAAYLLVQSTIVQDFALQEAQKRISDLEAQVAAAQATSVRAPAGNTASFLPQGPWSNRAAAPPPPPTPETATMGAPARPGWGVGAVPPAPPPAYGQQAYAQPQQGPSFLRQTATMAAGVAGGALLFQGIQSLFSGHSMFGGVANAAGMPGEVINETVNNYYGDQPPVPQERPDPGNQPDQAAWGDQGGGVDQGYQDAGYDDQGGGDFGGDFGDDSGYA